MKLRINLNISCVTRHGLYLAQEIENKLDKNCSIISRTGPILVVEVRS